MRNYHPTNEKSIISYQLMEEIIALWGSNSAPIQHRQKSDQTHQQRSKKQYTRQVRPN